MAKRQHFHFNPGVAPDLNLPDNMGRLTPLPRAERISDLGRSHRLFNEVFFPGFQAILKARQRLTMLSNV